jgi:hypothetical protein
VIRFTSTPSMASERHVVRFVDLAGYPFGADASFGANGTSVRETPSRRARGAARYLGYPTNIAAGPWELR